MIIKSIDFVTQQYGSGVSFGPLARNAVLSARIDNREHINVVDELKDWESVGLNPDENTYARLSWVYALNGNTQGVIDIIDHMKSTGLSVGETLIESMVHSLSRGGYYSEADSMIKKFTPALNEVRLRCAASSGAISRCDYDVAVNILNPLASCAQLYLVENNRIVLSVLYEMMEAGQLNAIDKFRHFLSLSDEGTLLEWNNNPGALARARRAICEGQLNIAFRIYQIVHPKFKNRGFEENLLKSLALMLKDEKNSIDDVFKLAKEMETSGIMRDHRKFLLYEASSETSRAKLIFDYIKKEGELRNYLVEKPEIRMKLAHKLSQELLNCELESDRIMLFTDIATVLFTFNNELPESDIKKGYPIIHSLVGHDTDLVISVLKEITANNVHGEFATAIVHQLLDNEDSLAREKLDRILSSHVIRYIKSRRIQHLICKLVLNPSKDTENDEKWLQCVARLIDLDFSCEKSKYASKRLTELLASEQLSMQRASKLINYAKEESHIQLTTNDIADAIEFLNKKSQKEKIELVKELKKGNVVYARWKMSSVESLEEELEYLRASKLLLPDVENTLIQLILEKILFNKPMNLAQAERNLARLTPKSLEVDRIMKRAVKIQSIALRLALKERRLDMAQSFWNIKIATPSLRDTLTYIVHLFLYGNVDHADSLCELLKDKSLDIYDCNMDQIIETLGEVDPERLSDIYMYLKEKLNLEEKDTRIMLSCITTQQLERLIKDDRLSDAFNLICEHSMETKSAIGQYELAAAAIRKNRTDILKDVFNMVMNIHGKNIAFLDLSLSMLEEGQTTSALKILEAKGLTVSSGKLRYFIRRSVAKSRPDVLLGLFTGLSVEGRASTVDLNLLLSELCDLYCKADNFAALEVLLEEINRISFPLDEKLRKTLESLPEMNRFSSIGSLTLKDILRTAVQEDPVKAIKLYETHRLTSTVPDWGVVKLCSVALACNLEEIGFQLLRQHYDATGSDGRVARKAVIKEDQVVSALRRVISSNDGVEKARKLYTLMLEMKYCTNKDTYVALFIDHTLNGQGLLPAVQALQQLIDLGRVKSLSRSLYLIAKKAYLEGTDDEKEKVDAILSVQLSNSAVLWLKGFILLEDNRGVHFAETLQRLDKCLSAEGLRYIVDLAGKWKKPLVLESLLKLHVIFRLDARSKALIYDQLIIIYGKKGNISGLETLIEEILDNPERKLFLPSLHRIAHFFSLWPGGVVPYDIAPHYSLWEREVILSGMAEFPKHTCISFRPRKASDKFYLQINKYYKLERCFSYIGRQTVGIFRTKQGNYETRMKLDPSCLVTNGRGTVMHELMHILGFYHEHQRDDRDPRVKGNAQHYNYKIYPRKTSYYMGRYDRTSIMHYNFPGIVYSRSYFSASDIQRINTLYKCKSNGTAYFSSSNEDKDARETEQLKDNNIFTNRF
uniref:Metalloendopeptidase n=1 Tax=Heterorhabditis bacteriophora TaxID=37862 RepID=A0A1I7XMH0_HETBA